MSTGDGVIGYVAVYLYLGRCGREWGDRSPGDWYDMWMYISTGDVVVGKRSIDLY